MRLRWPSWGSLWAQPPWPSLWARYSTIVGRSGVDNGDALDETHEICRDLKAMLNDVNLSDGSEERYEVDLSLRSYFGDNRQKIQRVAEKLREVRTGFLSRKDKKMNAFGEFLEWTVNEFYRYDYDEEERIRIWSQNVPEFHSKMTKTLAMYP